jgi:hypothetical protein
MTNAANPCYCITLPELNNLKLRCLPKNIKIDFDIAGFLKTAMGDEDSSLMFRGIMIK